MRPPSAVARDADSVPALEIQFYVNFGGSMERSQAFAAQCMAEPAEVVGSETASLIGAPDTVTASARSEAVTLEAHDPLDNAGARAIARAQNATRVRDIVVARPLKDMEMPYASYQARACASPCIARALMRRVISWFALMGGVWSAWTSTPFSSAAYSTRRASARRRCGRACWMAAAAGDSQPAR